MKFLTQYKGLGKEIYLLAVIRGINMTGHMFVFPFTSLLITGVYGFSVVASGYFMFVINALSAASFIAGGKFADNVGRRKLLLLSFSGIAILMLTASVISESPLAMLFISIAYCLVSFSLPGISALALDKCEPGRSPEALSLIYLTGNIGCALGPILAGFLFYDHRPWAFRVLALAFIITFSVTLIFITDKNPAKRKIEENKGNRSGYIKVILKKPILIGFIAALAISSVCYSVIGYILPLNFSDNFGLEKGAVMYSMIWSVNGFVVIFLTPIIIALLKKRSQLSNAGIGYLLYAIGFGAFIFHINSAFYYIATIIWTAGEIIISTGAAVFISDESPEEYRGSSMGVYEFARNIGKCIGPIIYAHIVDALGYGASWGFSSVTCLLLVLLITYMYYGVFLQKKHI